MICHNRKIYSDNEPIEWDIAIDQVGFYFERARYLGLPKPPACFVFDNPNPTPEQMEIIGNYHKLFNEAELCDIENIDTFDTMPKHGIN
jgi:hypothetical protein